MAWTLCTKIDVTDIHPIAESILKDSWSDWAEELIRQRLGEPNLGGNEVIVGEYHDGDGTPILRVRRPMILSVEDVKISGSNVDAGEYVIFPTYIQLKYQTFPKGNLNVTISYTSGGDVSKVVQMTAAAMIAAIANYHGRMGSDSSIKWGQSPNREGEENPNRRVGLTSHLDTIMRRMLRRRRIRVR
jgi:hypothetical protein